MKVLRFLKKCIINFVKSIFHNWAIFIVGAILLYIIFSGFVNITTNQVIIDDKIELHHYLGCKEVKI